MLQALRTYAHVSRVAFLTICEKNELTGWITAKAPVFYAGRTLFFCVAAHFSFLPLACFAIAILAGAPHSPTAFGVTMAVPAAIALWWESRYVQKTALLLLVADSLANESPTEKERRWRNAEWYRWGSFGLWMLSIIAVMAAAIVRRQLNEGA